MVFAILLDDYQPQVGSDEYAVSFSGSREDCQAQTGIDGAYQVWRRADYTEGSSEPITVSGPLGNRLSGRIVALQPVRSLAVKPATSGMMTTVIATGLAAGIIGGLVVAARPKRKSKP
jgi:hypothetical protein